MTQPSWMKGPPTRILLATDLSARSDRALDRAALLAGQWKAKLAAVHVLEEFEPGAGAALPSWRRPADPLSIARREVIADLGAVADNATIVIEDGQPGDAILRAAEAEGSDLIVAGIAKDERLGRFFLGRTVDRLLRGSRVPVLVVKGRARLPYQHIVVATDFSESSRHALVAAINFFPGSRLALFHAYDVPMAGIVPDAENLRRAYRAAAEKECDAFLQEIRKEKPDWRPDIVLEHGDPDSLLRDYVRDKGADLVVLGTHGRSALLEVLLGSVAKQILDYLPCDALVVREPRAAVEA